MANRTLGKPEIANYPLPYIPGFITSWRAAINADDSVPYEASPLGLNYSRFGYGNVIVVDVIANDVGVVIELWVKEGTDLIFVSSQTTVVAAQQLIFKDLLARPHFVRVAGATSKAITLNVGVSQ